MKRRNFYNKTQKISEEESDSKPNSENKNQISKNIKSFTFQNSKSSISENNDDKQELIIYSKFVEEVISEINFARTKPSENTRT